MSKNKATGNPLLIIGPSLQKHGIGGVTIHVQRLRDYLERNSYEYVFVDYKSNHLFQMVKSVSHSKQIHIHISNPIYQFAMVLFCRLMGKKVIMTLHGNYGRFTKLKNWMVRSALKMATVPVIINEKSYEACKGFNKNTRLIPAFIPPQKEEFLQQEIIDLLKGLHENGKRIVSTNAYNISTDTEGNDTYGIDFLVDYFKYATDSVLVVSDPSGNYHKRYTGLDFDSNSVRFIDYPHPYFELLKLADFFVRNTSTDGDALSVKEALYLGVPTLCSDVVDRPEGVCLFKYSDSASFTDCFKNATVPNVTMSNGAETLMELYKEI